jgi:hypothetical protein
MKLSEPIDNNVRDYPLWSLILGLEIIGLLAVEHVIRYKQTQNVSCFPRFTLILFRFQYLLAILSVNITFLTVILDFLTTFANALLLFNWADSTQKQAGKRVINAIIMRIIGS